MNFCSNVVFMGKLLMCFDWFRDEMQCGRWWSGRWFSLLANNYYTNISMNLISFYIFALFATHQLFGFAMANSDAHGDWTPAQRAIVQDIVNTRNEIYHKARWLQSYARKDSFARLFSNSLRYTADREVLDEARRNLTAFLERHRELVKPPVRAQRILPKNETEFKVKLDEANIGLKFDDLERRKGGALAISSARLTPTPLDIVNRYAVLLL